MHTPFLSPPEAAGPEAQITFLDVPSVSAPVENDGSLTLERTGATSHREKENNPSEFWRSQLHFRDTVVAKVREFGRPELVEKLAACQSQRINITCINCSRFTVAFNHCDLKFCPLCTPRLAARRRESIEAWTKKVRQPKHVVLTMRNHEAPLTVRYARNGQRAVSKLRRLKFAREWKGGLVSTELTNESRGWHLHYHLLVDARWIDEKQLAVVWGNLVGQDFAIVKVKDAREKQYLAEVTKYAVKGSMLASWTGEQIVQFITTFKRVRTFQVFGSLFKMRAEMSAFLDEAREHKAARQCECGCKTFRVQDHVGTTEEHIEAGMPNVRSFLIGERPRLTAD